MSKQTHKAISTSPGCSGRLWGKVLRTTVYPAPCPVYPARCPPLLSSVCRGSPALYVRWIRHLCTWAVFGLDTPPEILAGEPDAVTGWDVGERVECLHVGGMCIVTGDRTWADRFQTRLQLSRLPPRPFGIWRGRHLVRRRSSCLGLILWLALTESMLWRCDDTLWHPGLGSQCLCRSRFSSPWHWERRVESSWKGSCKDREDQPPPAAPAVLGSGEWCHLESSRPRRAVPPELAWRRSELCLPNPGLNAGRWENNGWLF